MERLRALTLIYTAVLVLALVASLIAVWVYLHRIANVLAEARTALAQVRDETAPLHSSLAPLNDAIASAAETLESAGKGSEGA